MSNIKKIVLTGGPCAGKTTALVKVIEHFSSLGFKVFTIPEVPTLFTQAGMDYLTDNKSFFYEGEKSTLEIQLALEDKFTQMAEQCTQSSIIICDRGALDISAYMDQTTWDKITSEVGTSTMELRDHRYDAVIHMVSAADGAEKFYTTATNAQRLEKADDEGLAVARHLDRRVMEAWAGHSHLRVINNHENFENKINRVLKEISSVLGLPQPITEERKYRVEVTGEIPDSVKSEIIQTYLTAEPGAEVRLRKRIWEGKRVNVHTTIKRLPNNEQVEVERQVSNNLYDSLLQQADPYRRPIEKTRRSFIWKGQYFELDSYHRFNDGMQILETKGVAYDETINFPPFIKVVEDITGRKEYYNYNLALRSQ